MRLNISNQNYLNEKLQHAVTVQEEEEIKYIPEGAKCDLFHRGSRKRRHNFPI